MGNKIENIIKLVIILILISPISIKPQNPDQSVMDVSNITMWVSSEGFHDWIVPGNWNGAYPNGKNVGVIYSEGINWGGLVHDDQSQIVRVNGNDYGSGTSPITKLFRVRSDYLTADLILDAADYFRKDRYSVTNEDINNIKNQYENDWNEWPADKGAPYFDKNKDGKYDPYADVPGVPGAIQTLWINYNDNLSTSNRGSIPIGLEIQETYWAYYQTGPLSNVIYKKVDIIYKGNSNSVPDSRIDSMYIAEWADVDVGKPFDDFTGCDTVLNLGYAYNAGNNDALYNTFSLNPPAMGYSFIQGVSEFSNNPGDSAIFNFRWRKGRKFVNRKSMNRFIYWGAGGTWTYPSYNYSGTLEYYNIMRGYRPLPRYPYSSAFPTVVTDYTSDGVFQLDGDPVAGTGKVDGYIDGPGDRELIVISGPFNLKLKDTAEVVIALVGGLGTSNLNSITNLKYNTKSASDFYNFFVNQMTSGEMDVPFTGPKKTDTTPGNYVLKQNYPNPFNSSTVIKYELPSDAFVTLTIYDILGREIKKLVNEEKPAGSYSVVFNAADLPSGIYFSKISFNNRDNKLSSDNLYKVNKMILLK